MRRWAITWVLIDTAIGITHEWGNPDSSPVMVDVTIPIAFAARGGA
jgi:hypothetical protein